MHFLLWLDLASEPDITPENALAVAYRSILNDAADPHLKWTITHDNVSLTPWADDVVVCDMSHNLPPRVNLEGVNIRLPQHVWDAVSDLVGNKVSELVKAGEIRPDERGERGESHPLWLAERMIDGQLLTIEQDTIDLREREPIDVITGRNALMTAAVIPGEEHDLDVQTEPIDVVVSLDWPVEAKVTKELLGDAVKRRLDDDPSDLAYVRTRVIRPAEPTADDINDVQAGFTDRFAVVHEIAGETHIANYVGKFRWMHEKGILRVVGRKRGEREQPVRVTEYPVARVIRVTSEIPA